MNIEQTFDIYEAKQNVKSALAATSEWRKSAAEDFAFMQGKQWQDGDLKKMREAGRPAITINRIRPVINLLCGYASQNETEPDFLPRSEEDDRISRVAKGITKYCLDRANYQRNKGKCFRDKIICGLANYWVSYEFDYTKLDGTIQIERVSPFDAFIDPECKKDDLSDAQYVGRYSWESTAKLKQVYPDKVNEIDALKHKYDDTEQEAGIVETVDGEALWYNNNYNKIRVVQYWYKEYGKRNVFMTKEGLIDEANPLFVVLMATGKKPTSIPDTKIRYATFADDVLLEEGIESCSSFVSLTGIDEENAFLSLYAKSVSNAKIVTKINRISFDDIIEKFDLGSMIYPKHITAEYIVRYVRGLQNSVGSNNVEALYKIIHGEAEALEFYIKEDSSMTDKTLEAMPIREGVLVAGIIRNGKVMIPNGKSTFQKNDSVIVITKITGMQNLEDILK